MQRHSPWDSLHALHRTAVTAPVLDPEAEKLLIIGLKAGSAEALRSLLSSHLRMVMAMARRYAGFGVSFEDTVSEGIVGLLEAAKRFDPERGTRFSTYGAWWVRAYVRRYALANRRIVGAPSTRNARKVLSALRTTQNAIAQVTGRRATRSEVATGLGVAEDDVAMVEAALGARDVPIGQGEEGTYEVADARPTPEQQTAEAELETLRRHRIGEALAKLSEREREILIRRYLADDVATLAVVGESLGLSRERVRQLEKRAQRKLRTALVECVA